MQEEKKHRIKDISKKFCEIFSGVVIIIVAILMLIADKVFDASGKMYKEAIKIAIIAYVVIFIAALIISVIFMLSSTNKKKYGQLKNDFDDEIEKVTQIAEIIENTNLDMKASIELLSKNIEKERRIITTFSIGSYVLDSNEVIKLEESVGNNKQNEGRCKIYIQSSLFVLEKGPLEKVILCNLRKGVKYIYIIPKNESYVNEYLDMLQDWYRLYSQFIVSKEDYDQIVKELNYKKNDKNFSHWNSNYRNLFDEVGIIWRDSKLSEKERCDKIKNIKCKIQRSFKELIETHIDDESEFFITVAAYEVKRNKWEAIIKLPTENTDNEYYAFKIPSKNNGEIMNFIHTFQNRFKNIEYNPNDISTMGGKYNLDFSKIFLDDE